MPVTIKQAHLKYKDPDTGEYVSVSAIGSPLNPVLDVQVDNSSIVDTGIASIPKATGTTLGLVKGWYYGVRVNNDGDMYVSPAAETEVKAGTSNYLPIVPSNQHKSVFYGLAKLAGQDMASSSNAIGTYTPQAKTAIKTMLGVTDPTVLDVQMNGTSILSNGVANIPLGTPTTPGVVRSNDFYGTVISSGVITLYRATDTEIKQGTVDYHPITPLRQHQSAFYGLAKAAGDTTQASSNNTVGTYTDDAKAAIKTMLGIEDPNVSDVQVNGTSIVNNGVANIPVAGTDLGLVKAGSSTQIYASGTIEFRAVGASEVKAGTSYIRALTPERQHASVFYGLAKAAGADMASSSNAIGTYTPEAKAAIQTMLGVDIPTIAEQVEVPLVQTISGSTPTIVGQPNTRYVCGTVTELTITPSSSGSIDVIFNSGTTQTILSVPSTVRFPAWFDKTSLEPSTTYEIMITDGVYGSVMTWPI